MSDRYKYQGSVTFSEDGFNGHTPHLPGGLKTLTIADTGYSTGTAQRIKKAVEYFEDEDVPFYMTYGDSVSDVNLDVGKHLSKWAQNTLTGMNFKIG